MQGPHYVPGSARGAHCAPGSARGAHWLQALRGAPTVHQAVGHQEHRGASVPTLTDLPAHRLLCVGIGAGRRDTDRSRIGLVSVGNSVFWGKTEDVGTFPRACCVCSRGFRTSGMCGCLPRVGVAAPPPWTPLLSELVTVATARFHPMCVYSDDITALTDRGGRAGTCAREALSTAPGTSQCSPSVSCDHTLVIALGTQEGRAVPPPGELPSSAGAREVLGRPRPASWLPGPRWRKSCLGSQMKYTHTNHS